MSTLKTTNLQHASAASPAIVLASDGTATAQLSSLNGGALSGARNRIINGAMEIDQRAKGTVNINATNNGYTTADRWQANKTADDKYSVQTSTTAPAGFSSSILCTSLSAYSVSSTDIFFLQQSIEGFNFADMAWGTASAKTVTLSFWVRSSLTGTFGGCLANSAHNRSYPFSYSISSANTWEQKSVTVAGDTTGTWVGATNGTGLQVIFGLGGGSTRSGTAGAWNSNTNYTATGATSVVGTNGATFYITGVQLEAGTVATPFERRSYGQELALCQRYYWKNLPSSTGVDLALGIVGGSTGRCLIIFPQIMRAAPTFSISSLKMDDEQAAAYTVTGISSTNAGTQTAWLALSAASMTTGRPVRLQTSSTSGFIDASSEL